MGPKLSPLRTAVPSQRHLRPRPRPWPFWRSRTGCPGQVQLRRSQLRAAPPARRCLARQEQEQPGLIPEPDWLTGWHSTQAMAKARVQRPTHHLEAQRLPIELQPRRRSLKLEKGDGDFLPDSASYWLRKTVSRCRQRTTRGCSSGDTELGISRLNAPTLTLQCLMQPEFTLLRL
jgi:hypothetical protein